MAKQRSLVLSALASLVLLVGGTTPAAAQGRNVRCGDAVTSNLKLTHDLVGCAGNGLVVAAAGVTIDLAGHRLTGSDAAGTAGILADGYPDLRVVGGLIEHFQVGIAFANADHLIVARTNLQEDTVGAVLINSRGGILSRIKVSGATDAGVRLVSADRYKIIRSRLQKNGDGILLYKSTRNLIAGNTSSDSGSGIVLVTSSNHNTILRNTTNREQDTGVLLDDHADDNVIVGNHAGESAFAGIAVGASDRNLVRGNHTSGNSGSGIAVVDNAAGTRVVGNVANDNGFVPPGCVPNCPLLNDGIHVDAAGTTLTGNKTDRNADLGIDAADGVIDGGRNTATRNGDSRQCIQVLCT